MDNQRYTYRLRNFFIALLGWEVIFWGLSFLLLLGFGYFDEISSELKLDFKAEKALWLFLLLPVLLYIFFRFLQARNQLVSRFETQAVRRSLWLPIDEKTTFLKFFFFRNAFVFLVFTLAQPVLGTKKVDGFIENTELLIALDISSSMNTKDIDAQLSRLQIAERAMIQLINNLRGEKLGIVVFAGQAYAHLPLTLDYDAAKMYVNEIVTTMISDQGTNIPNALQSSQLMYSKSKARRLLVLLTDAENHEVGIEEAMQTLSENNVQVAVLGIGTSKGGLIPNHPKKPQLGYKVSEKGKLIVSKLNRSLIEKIAKQSTGIYAISTNAFPDLTRLVQELKQNVKHSETQAMQLDVKYNRYQIPLFLALLNWLLFAVWPFKMKFGFLFFKKKR